MSFDTVLKTLNDLPVSVAIREGDNLFPWIESLHVLSIVTVLGTIAIVDLRLIGLPSHKRSARELIKELLPITWFAFVFAVIFGALLFLSNAVVYGHNSAFQWKMMVMAEDQRAIGTPFVG